MAMGPDQQSMDGNPMAAGRNDESPVLLSGAGRASKVATMGYVLVAFGHLMLLRIHSRFVSSADATGLVTRFFATLAVVEVALAHEATIFAIGAYGRASSLVMQVLTFLGRVRLLGAAMAWPWLMPWVAELSCRSGAVSPATGNTMIQQFFVIAVFITGFFALRELSFAVTGEPASALDPSAKANVGDCLPSQAVLGGQFRLDKADLEETGRAVFVPARPRKGLYVGAGLALLVHLIFGVVLARATGVPPLLLMGGIGALLGRRWGELPKFRGKEDGVGVLSPWRREGPRLIARVGELIWIMCCVLELQRGEAMPSWLTECA